MGIQEVDIISMVSSITKYAVTVTETEDIPLSSRKRHMPLQHGDAGAVWIDIPLDIQGSCRKMKRVSGAMSLMISTRM